MITEPNEQAVEAAAREIDPHAWDDLRPLGRLPFIAYSETRTIDELWGARRDMARQHATRVLRAAMPHLRRTIPNTIEALKAESVGAVIRAKSGEVYVRGSLAWWVQAGEEQVCSDDYLASPLSGITEWTVLWEGDDE